jgi:hypothetical protein
MPLLAMGASETFKPAMAIDLGGSRSPERLAPDIGHLGYMA